MDAKNSAKLWNIPVLQKKQNITHQRNCGAARRPLSMNPGNQVLAIDLLSTSKAHPNSNSYHQNRTAEHNGTSRSALSFPFVTQHFITTAKVEEEEPHFPPASRTP
jgi:hypothetical protein